MSAANDGASKEDASSGVARPEAGERLWRMRKRDHVVDAEIRPAGAAGVELRYAYNGALTYRRRWTSKDLAVKEATTRRAELERDGWVFHW